MISRMRGAAPIAVGLYSRIAWTSARGVLPRGKASCVPKASVPTSPVMPNTCDMGISETERDSPRYRSFIIIRVERLENRICMGSSALACESITPRGCPVVPDVYMIASRSVRRGRGSAWTWASQSAGRSAVAGATSSSSRSVCECSLFESGSA